MSDDAFNHLAAGQQLMVGFDGKVLDDQLRHYIQKLGVGGIILFRRNVDTPEQIADLCKDAQACARDAGQPPLLIAIDQEGGTVVRLPPPFTQFAGAPSIHRTREAHAFGSITATELIRVGINMNMAPVLDLSPADMNSVMAKRAFGADPHVVGRLGSAVIQAQQRHGLMAVAKHFPGIGHTTLDSHLDRPCLDRSQAQLHAADLMPFRQAIENDVAGIMLSHVVYRSFDARWPASLSPELADNLLRRQLGYNGLIVTDDLDMGAIDRHLTIEETMAQVLIARVDMALICHPGPKIERACQTICRCWREDRSIAASATQSVNRIMKLKRAYLAHLFD